MSKNRRPQAPKRRDFVAKNMNKFNRPQTHRDRTKYDRYEDYLKDQLDDLVNNDELWADDDDKKKEFLSKLKGEDFDPHQYKNYEEWLDRGYEEEFFNWDPLDDDDYDY